jgi:uncharacterized damage-inducible protein DinB
MSARAYPQVGADPRASMEAWLDFLREGVELKVQGLTDEQGRRSLVPSNSTVTGMVQHLARVEHWWFHVCLAGQPMDPEIEALDEWAVEATSIAAALNLYRAECARSRHVSMAMASITTRSANSQYPDCDYAWVAMHMIEETARHLGHIDILREQLDGAVGR